MFVGIVVSVLAGEAMIRLSGRERAGHLLSDAPNMTVPQSFASIVPGAIVIGGFVLFRIFLVWVGVPDSLPELVQKFLQLPFQYKGGSFGTAVLYNIATQFMWLFGIHGNNVLDDVAQTVFVTAMDANVAAVSMGLPAPNLITKTLLDAFVYMGGSGTTLALLVAMLIFGQRRSNRTLLKYALPNSIFNINEPLIFGIPIVLNPFYAIPFILTPVIMFLTTAFAMKLGLVPYTVFEVSWATPIFVSGYMSTRSVAGVVLQLVNLCLAVLIYAPFVRLTERMGSIRFRRAYQQLSELVFSGYTISPSKLIHRVDEIGAVARQLSNQLDTAMRNREMFLNFQPIVNVHNQQLHSVEALLRWKHPQHGLINPMVTVTLAEETDSISKLGFWVLEQAIMQRALWTKQGLGDFPVSVNISPHQLDDITFYNQVMGILEKHQVPVGQLQIEITEGAALVENATSITNLENLHQAGIRIAMDDFGVGHSSLLYLRVYPITTLKVDGSLSRGVTENPVNLDIIATIYDLCHLLKVDTIVEYVEDQEQLIKLMDIGVSLVQGYLYSPPLDGGKIGNFIKSLSAVESS